MIKFFILIFIFWSAADGSEITIVSYNVENLFDNIKDSGKDDCQFTLNCKMSGSRKNYNWTDQKIDLKLDQISKVIKSIGAIELLILQEVENINILTKLARKLEFDHYWISESDDFRGIDIAILYKAKSKFKIHEITEIKNPKGVTSRSLVKIAASNNLFFFALHWPSQKSNHKLRSILLKQLLDEIAKLPDGGRSIIAGDFNIIDEAFFNPLRDNHFDSYESSKKDNMPPGTYFYSISGQWSRFDRFWISKNLLSSTDIFYQLGSFRIHVMPWMTESAYVSQGYLAGSTITGVPKRYNFQTKEINKAGFSDHFPVLIRLIIN
jgi:endonuclease/exonuclease/phosphatase family metal-dependent hydrolase